MTNAAAAITDERKATIIAGLRELLDGMVEEQSKPPAPGSPKGGLYKLSEMREIYDPPETTVLDPFRTVRESAFRLAIVSLGKAIHEIGGDRLMEEVADAVDDNGGVRTDILSKAWDGIGGWLA